MAKISLSQISKQYTAATHAVQTLDLEVEDGEFFGLLGPSGSGKTTVLRMIAGLEDPTGGTIDFDGVNVERKTPQARNVAMIFEQNALYPHMTVRQNISYPLRIRKVSKAEQAESVKRICELLGIEHLLDRRPTQMSGGQQQRVAVARALVRTPAVCCMDEPIAHLDAALRGRLRGDLRRLQQSLGVTSVIVTHDPIEAMTMTDRVAVMRDGALQQVGSPRDIHNNPCNAFVAQFFGLHTMNQVKGTLDAGAAGAATVSGVETLLPPRVLGALGRHHREFTLGIRPELVTVRRRSDAASQVGSSIDLPGLVYVSETLGEGNFVRVRVGEAIVHAITPAAASYDIDEPVTVSLPVDRMYVFGGEGDATLAKPEATTPVAIAL
jgi:ABC-type sugar transport system ATPase subunit